MRREAVQVGVFGEADQEAELQSVLRSVLANLEGETNWLTEREQDERIGEGIAAVLVSVAGVMGVVLLAVYGRRERRRTQRLSDPRDRGAARPRLARSSPDRPDPPPPRRAKLIRDPADDSPPA